MARRATRRRRRAVRPVRVARVGVHLVEEARVVVGGGGLQGFAQRDGGAGRRGAGGVVDGHVVVEGGRHLRGVGRPCGRHVRQAVVERPAPTFERDDARAARGRAPFGAARGPLVLFAGERGERLAVGRPRELEVDQPLARSERAEVEAVAVADVDLLGLEDGHGGDERRGGRRRGVGVNVGQRGVCERRRGVGRRRGRGGERGVADADEGD